MAEKASKSMSLLKLAQERKKKLEDGKRKQPLDYSVPYLPKDCVSNILIRLDLESLQRSRFVCKPWYNIINGQQFIIDNLHRAETVLIFLSPVNGGSSRNARFDRQDSVFVENPNTFSVESKIFELKSVHLLHRLQIHPSLKYAMKYIVFADGKSMIREYNATCLGKIRASCDGLIIIDNKLKNGELAIMNPVTRKLCLLPLGTIYPPHEESFGLARCQDTKGYKLVHLFRDESQFIGCEILQIGENSWRVVDGPSFGLLKWFGFEPVSAIGALHWVPEIDHSEHIVSMMVVDEKFHKIMLPKSSRSNDRILEVSDHLYFVAHEEMNEISVWILESLTGEPWTKIYTIKVGCIRDLIPLYFSRFEWEIFFMDKDGSVFVFNFRYQEMRKISIKKGSFPIHGASYLGHVNSLVSWQINDDDYDAIDP